MKKPKEVSQSITSVQSGLTADQSARQRRYFISMMIRTICFILTVVLPSPYRWIALTGAVTLPYIAVIAANAGGAFSPIGDVTTTLLWIGGQVSAVGIVKILLLPSIMVLFIPLLLASYKMKGFAVLRAQISMADAIREEKMKGSLSVFLAGVFGLVMVPVIKTITGLPPFIGVLISLAFVS